MLYLLKHQSKKQSGWKICIVHIFNTIKKSLMASGLFCNHNLLDEVQI